MSKQINWDSLGEVVRIQQQAEVQEMMEMMRIRSMRPDLHALQYGLLGLNFFSPFARDYYYDDTELDEYYEDEDYFVDRNDTRGGRQVSPVHRAQTSLAPHPRIKELTAEEKEKLAKKLLKQEEKLKEKAEKKRLKRVRQREKKRVEKANSDIGNTVPDDTERGLSTSSEKQKENTEINNLRETTERCVEPGPIDTETEVTSLEETSASKDTDEDEKEGEGGAAAREPEEFDMNSCFVATAASIVQRQLNQNPKPKSMKNTKKHKHKTAAPPPPEEKPKTSQQPQLHESKQEKVEVEVEDNITRSNELASIGNQYAARGQLDVAVKYFTDAIKHNPKEYKLFGNRSFCYERMNLYEQALGDADLALSLSPGWVKGLFRRGKALCGLKRYYEAASTYQEVLSQDPSRADALQELRRVQTLQLVEMGFTQEQSSAALEAHGAFEEAVDALSGVRDEGHLQDQAAEEEWTVHRRSPAPPRSLARTPSPAPGSSRPRPSHTLPANAGKPELFPVWVGSLAPTVTEATLHSLFSRAGEVYSIKVLRGFQCAFVNYTQKEDCEKAIQLMNGFLLEGTSLAVRHPNRIHPHLGVSLSAETDPPLWSTLRPVRRRT